MDHKIENDQYWIKRDPKEERRDWNIKTPDWITGYWKSSKHPHRDLIIQELKKIEFESLLEVGCNAGGNILRIRDEFDISDLDLAGIDVNADSIQFIQEKLPDVLWRIGNAKNLPFHEEEYDVVLADAILMYADPEESKEILSEMNRVAKKAIIIVDWFSEKEEIKDQHWCRDYEKILKCYKLEVHKIKIKKWPTKSGNWERNGYIFVAVRQ